MAWLILQTIPLMYRGINNNKERNIEILLTEMWEKLEENEQHKEFVDSQDMVDNNQHLLQKWNITSDLNNIKPRSI